MSRFHRFLSKRPDVSQGWASALQPWLPARWKKKQTSKQLKIHWTPRVTPLHLISLQPFFCSLCCLSKRLSLSDWWRCSSFSWANERRGSALMRLNSTSCISLHSLSSPTGTFVCRLQRFQDKICSFLILSRLPFFSFLFMYLFLETLVALKKK